MSKRGKKSSHPGIRQVGPKEYVVRVAMRDLNTKRQRELERRLEGVTLTTALKRQSEMREELRGLLGSRAGVVTKQPRASASNETLTAFAKRWLVHVEKTGRKRPHVIERDMQRLDDQILPLLGHLPLVDIGKPELSLWMEKLGQLKKVNGSPYAKETLLGVWRLLRTMLRDAVTLAGLAENPARDMRFHAMGVPPKVKTVLTKEEVARFLAAAEHETIDVKTILWLGFTTGMRHGELTALRHVDIDSAHGLVRVMRSQVHGKVFPTKTTKNRSAPLHPDVVTLLKEYTAWKEKRELPSPEPGLLFPSTVGTYRAPAVLRDAMVRCADRAGIALPVSPHTMRRTFNNLVRQAAGEIAARAIVGHATEGMTEHYSNVTPIEKHEALKRALGTDLAALVRAAGVAAGDPQQTVAISATSTSEKGASDEVN
jgi:integrase